MNMEKKLDFYRSRLLQLSNFLQNYLPLANAHTVDFLVDEMWESNVPEKIRNELMMLSHEDLVALPVMSEYHISNNDLDKFKVSSLAPHNQGGDSEKPTYQRCLLKRTEKCTWHHEHLAEFVLAAHSNTLSGLNVLTAKEEYFNGERKSFQIHEFMCAKKAHEVEVMASICADYFRNRTDQVVDIGSGLGYLSGHLAFLHNMKVLGIDSSNSNTHGADKRSTRLAKHWPLLLANAQLSQLGLAPVRTKGKKKQKYMNQNVTDISPDEFIEPKQYSELAIKLKDAKQLSPKGSFHPVTLHVTADIDLVGLIQQNLKDTTTLETENESIGDKTEPNVYNAVTDENTSKSDAATVPNRNLKCTLQKFGAYKIQGEDFALTGLHTCGGLASTVLKLFISNPHAVCVCNVGCCYHLLDEEFIKSPFEKGDCSTPREFHFPMSNCLRQNQFYLGRNARMLACQAPARLSSAREDCSRMVPERSLHWRAVLQVILYNLVGESRDDWHVGKLATKCTSFVEYVQKALQKLDIENQLSDHDIKEYEERFLPSEKHMKCFFYLRTTLAACIESIILLDRLVYLLEQGCITEAFLVELFDPKTSPRCCALIASK